MKIVGLQIENFKRIRAVNVEPDGNTVVVSGRNAQGKSSVLDAIWAALAGRDGNRIDRPIRDGAEKARVSVDLGELIVTRTWDAKGSKLVVAAADGAKYGSPQQVLDGLIGKLTFDPMAFAEAAPKDQMRQLLSVLPFDLDALDAERAQVFEERTAVNRDVRQITAELESAVAAEREASAVPGMIPDEPVSSAEILEQIRAMQEASALWHRASHVLEAAEREVAELKAKLAEAELRKQAAAEAVEALPAPDQAELESLQGQLADVEKVNAAVRARQARKALQGKLTAAQEQADALTASLVQIDKQKADALAAADLPMPGLGFDEDGVTLNGVPFSQASAKEQRVLSMHIAMALNPEVRVVLLRDGSLLDREAMEDLRELADANDFQIWVERVEGGAATVVIEDGEIAVE